MKRKRESPIRPVVAAIVLAAGEGKRMADPTRAKVCHEVAPGKTAISFLMEELRKAGVDVIAVVVGVRAEQVMQEVAPRYPGTIFAYQPEQLGTGHATWCGARPLLEVSNVSTFLVTMGDKMTTARVIRRLIQRRQAAGADLVFAVSRCTGENEQGRVVIDEDGRPLGIVEVPDLVTARIWAGLEDLFSKQNPLPCARLMQLMDEGLPPSGKVPKVLRALREEAEQRTAISWVEARELASEARRMVVIGSREVGPGWVEKHSPFANEAVYVFSRRALTSVLDRLSPNNAQGEVYLTDAVAYLSGRPQKFRVEVCEIGQDEIASFNTPKELERVRASVASWLAGDGQ
jgi:bifunctional N-acetylglucosamine-1-phosphate-uridyltransferase/glucosamine-1-phosphate-acetyltransferase GlmU-like protein